MVTSASILHESTMKSRRREQEIHDHPVLSCSSGLIVLQSSLPSHKTSDLRFSTAWWVFVAVAAILLPVMVLASFDFGVTWDEKARHRYGELIWEFFRGLRARTATYDEDGGQ